MVTLIVTDTYAPNVVLVDLNGNLAVEGNVDGTHYYQIIPLYDNIDESLDEISNANEHWSTVSDNCLVYIDKNEDTNYLNDLSFPRVTEAKYWD